MDNDSENEEKDSFSIEKKIQQPTIQSSSRHITKAVFFNFLIVYGSIPINIILTMLISRFLGLELWGIYLYSLVLIGATQIIMVFIPPSIRTVILYKIPEMMVNNEQSKAKGLILYAVKVKTIITSLTAIGYFIVIWLWLLNDPLSLYPKILLIQIPTIIIFEIGSIFNIFLISIKNFKIGLITFFLEKFTLSIVYILLFFTDWNQIAKLYVVVVINILVISFSNVLKFISYQKKMGNFPIKKISKSEIKDSINFGLNFSITTSLSAGYKQLYYGVLNFFGTPSYITYNKICNNFSEQVLNTFSTPIGPILSDLEKTDQHQKMLILFKQTLRVLQIFVCFFTGILYFFSQPYILLIYEPEFIEVIRFIQVNIFIIYFSYLIRNYQALFTITNNERKMMFLNIIFYTILSCLAVFGMYFYSFYGLIIFTVIGYAIGSLIYWFYGKYILKLFKFSFFSLYFQFFGLILLIASTVFLGAAIIPYLPLSFINSIIIKFFTLFNFDISIFTAQIDSILNSGVYIIIFILLYVCYLIFFRVLTKEDIDRIEKLNMPIPFKKVIFRVSRKLLLSDNKKTIKNTIKND